jgi:hypothetical protein
LDALEFGIGNQAQYHPAFILHSSFPSQYRNWLAFPLYRLSRRPLPCTEGPKNCAAPSSLQRAALSSDDTGEPHRPHSPSSRVTLPSLCWRVDLCSSPLSTASQLVLSSLCRWAGEPCRPSLPLPVSCAALTSLRRLAGEPRRNPHSLVSETRYPFLPPSARGASGVEA